MQKIITTVVLVAAIALPLTAGSKKSPKVIKVAVSGSFSPDSITVKKGEPVRLEFTRDEKPTCATEVVFKDLGIEKKLPKGETVVVELTPSKSGDLVFACGMDMLKGKLVVQ